MGRVGRGNGSRLEFEARRGVLCTADSSSASSALMRAATPSAGTSSASLKKASSRPASKVTHALTCCTARCGS